MDVDVAPEPSEAERAVLAAFVRGQDEATPDVSQSPWARAALEEGIAANEGYGSVAAL
jgi:hypothetical protein